MRNVSSLTTSHLAHPDESSQSARFLAQTTEKLASHVRESIERKTAPLLLPYSGDEFIVAVTNNEIVPALTELVQARYNVEPSDNEVKSWEVSSQQIAQTIEKNHLYDIVVIPELIIPSSNNKPRRVDFAFAGMNENMIPTVVLTEVKTCRYRNIRRSSLPHHIRYEKADGSIISDMHPGMQAFYYREQLRKVIRIFRKGGGRFSVISSAFLIGIESFDEDLEKLLLQETTIADTGGTKSFPGGKNRGFGRHLSAEIGHGSGHEAVEILHGLFESIQENPQLLPSDNFPK